MAITPTSNWGAIQRRAIDPYSIFESQNINFLNAVIGSDRAKVSGLTIEHIVDSGKFYIHTSSGVCIKDYVLISFNHDSYVEVGNWPLAQTTYLVVVDYRFATINPPNIAKISVIRETQYNPAQHFPLYRITISGSVYPTHVTIDNLEEYIDFGQKYDELLTQLLNHMTNDNAHRQLYYTKSEVDNKIVGTILEDEAALLTIIQNMVNSSQLFTVDVDNDIIMKGIAEP